MHEKLNKNPNGNTFIPLSELVFRLCAFHRPGYDHVTIVFYNFTSFTVKSQNLMAILSDFEKASVTLQDVSFVSYGNLTHCNGTVFDPFVVAGNEMSRIIKERQLTDWISSIKLACSARMFPLCSGRNRAAFDNEDDEDEDEDAQ
ncbi:uncharacterized protein LOC116919777 [Daphnia magna]|uniref:uncharacterized protein LOC116919777 n=1 Tax=Daphnia magna TaxID=35525 RepID=UPI001E1BA8ED|nr:uncharacterized protein LOC116919777 [Daphnia magna]